MSPWLLLAVSIGLELSGTICLKLSEGMTRPLPVVGVIFFYLSAFTLMATCLKTLEVGTVYAIWSGAGTALIAIIGIVFWGELSLDQDCGSHPNHRRCRASPLIQRGRLDRPKDSVASIPKTGNDVPAGI